MDETQNPEAQEADEQPQGHPQWYTDNYPDLAMFLQMPQEDRDSLVGEASAVFGTVMASLTGDGVQAVTGAGKNFVQVNLDSFEAQMNSVPDGEHAAFLVGVAMETIGVMQMKIERLKKLLAQK